MSSHVQRRSDSDQDPHTRQSNTGVPPAAELSEQVRALGVNLTRHRPRDAQAERNGVIRHGQDERRGDALMFLWHGAAEEDNGRGKTHVHPERDDERRDEGLAPVGLRDGHRGREDGRDAEGHEGEHHDVWDWDLRYQDACHDRRDEACDRRGAVFRRSEEWRVVSELLEELPDVVEPDAEAGPAG